MQNEEYTIAARLEKNLVDAANAADEAIDTYVDEKDPVRKMNILMEGYAKATKALLDNVQDEIDIPKAVKAILAWAGRGENTAEKHDAAYYTPGDVADFVLGNPPFANIPGGVDGAMPGPDPAEEVGLPPARKSFGQLMRERFGLDMHRFATPYTVKYVGVRKSIAPERSDSRLFEIEVDKRACRATLLMDGDLVFELKSFRGASVCEKIATSGLLKFLNERRRIRVSHKRAKIRARAAKEGGVA